MKEKKFSVISEIKERKKFNVISEIKIKGKGKLDNSEEHLLRTP